jgi:GH15 family glucan-1,4-alpha-glucosidase
VAGRIEDYAVIGGLRSAALVGRDGSVDWLCAPRFDSPACFAALLGDERHGRWLLAPPAEEPAGGQAAPPAGVRSYRGDSLILETTWQTRTGTATVVDFMPARPGESPAVVRIVHGVSGTVRMHCDLRIRFGYGKVVPWVRRVGQHIVACAGPDSLWLRSGVPLTGRNFSHQATFDVHAGQAVPFTLSWAPSHLDAPDGDEAAELLAMTEQFWADWTDRCTYSGGYRDAVIRSLITLKALTYAPTGGIVAAATTSLPEDIGGVRNWDYRYCWLRDATITLEALLRTGYTAEAAAWRHWLGRAVAGDPADVQIMYGVAGERRLAEWEADWLPGYEGSAPVRIGNAAAGQFQLDVYGEVIDAIALGRQTGLDADRHTTGVVRALLRFLEQHWDEPDEGIWEVRGPRRHFVHSKVMAWVAFDRAIRLSEQGMQGPADRWRQIRDEIHAQVCERGFDQGCGTFTQYYGSAELDAAVLLIPEVGFLPPDDPRVRSTLEVIQRELVRDGLVLRYSQPSPAGAAGEAPNQVDGLPGTEGAFLACSFWLVNALELAGQHARATALFKRLLDLRNDVGLLSEEYDPRLRRQVGNTPQAFSHVPLIQAALNLDAHQPDKRRHGPKRRAAAQPG